MHGVDWAGLHYGRACSSQDLCSLVGFRLATLFGVIVRRGASLARLLQLGSICACLNHRNLYPSTQNKP